MISGERTELGVPDPPSLRLETAGRVEWDTKWGDLTGGWKISVQKRT